VKVARFDLRGEVRVGIVAEDAVRVLPPGTDPLAAVVGGSTVEVVPLDGLRLLPPLDPPSIRDFLTFEQHVEGMARNHVPPREISPQWYEAPTFYFTNPHSLVGAHDDVEVPPGCELLDFELEVAAVIGADGRDLTPEAAHEHIVAYTIFNDWSARDLQFAEMQVGLGPAKGKDSASTLGPWLVSASELEPYRRGDRLDLQLSVSVNGREIGSDSLANMAWSFEELVAYASRGTWVRAGDVLGSGTCGSGCLAELWGRSDRREPPALQVGDVVSMTVEGIGSIANRVVAGVAPQPIPKAKRKARV
jgi:2-keto-4-pentenoate hydratase/2-oxohepta-3-ene-1,7-dioic acid hydratase in catechol pathway